LDAECGEGDQWVLDAVEEGVQDGYSVSSWTEEVGVMSSLDDQDDSSPPYLCGEGGIGSCI